MILNLLYALLAVAFLAVYAWSFYNLPILVAGIRSARKSKKRTGESSVVHGDLPSVSIVVPVKNEKKVIGRLLDALAGLDYPAGKKEIIVVEDGSSDGTLDFCRNYAVEHNVKLRVLHKPYSDGKPSALNHGIKQARGEIVAVFDADSVPAEDALLKVVSYFEDDSVSAVQGRTLSINSEENMLTKFISREEAVWCEGYLRGKDDLNLFVRLKGTCQFFRRQVLKRLNGFDEGALSEDMELSARLTEQGHRIRYASDVKSWQESPSGLKQLLKQHVRWYRGDMEVAFKYGRLMASPSRRTVDAELTLFGPFVLIMSLLSLFAGGFLVFAPSPFGFVLELLMRSASVFGLASMFLCGLALICYSKPQGLRNALWIPFIYFFWILQSFIASYALLLIVLRRPRMWVRTEKSGAVRVAGSDQRMFALSAKSVGTLRTEGKAIVDSAF